MGGVLRDDLQLSFQLNDLAINRKTISTAPSGFSWTIRISSSLVMQGAVNTIRTYCSQI